MNGAVDLQPYFAVVSDNPLAHAFSGRGPVMPWRDRRQIAPESIEDLWAKLRRRPRRGRSIAYFHVPFCANHCLFCGFYRNAWHDDHSKAYTNRLIEELVRERESSLVDSAPISAVYLGGGTPSALHANDLNRLVRKIRDCLPLTSDCEITVEGRIIHFGIDKAVACIEAGANRFSIGVQTFSTEIRRRMGRKTKREEAVKFMADLLALDQAAVVCDLIYGFPNQTLEVWEEDIRTCVELGLDGLDLYCLNVFPGTPLDLSIRKGASKPAVDVSEQGAYYARGVELMAEAGWKQIANNHWALTTRERNRYNILSKQGAECLAYGSGAGGKLGKYSFAQHRDLEAYQNDVEVGRKPIAAIFEGNQLVGAHSQVVAGIEVGRLDLARVEASVAPGLTNVLSPLVEQWALVGLVEAPGQILRLTVAGRFWQSTIVDHLNNAIDSFAKQTMAA